MAKPATKSSARHEIVMGQLMEAAERLFAEKGVAGTSFQDLADAVGMTRTGIYHYVRNKDQMLEALIEGFTVDTARDMERLSTSGGAPAIDRLREGLVNLAAKVAEHPQRFRVLLTSEAAFSPELATQYRTARRETLAGLRALIDQSIAEGACKPVDSELAAFSLLGAANWLAFWYPRTARAGSAGPRETAAQLTSIALAGLLSSDEGGESTTSGVVARLRSDLDRLEKMVAEGSAERHPDARPHGIA